MVGRVFHRLGLIEQWGSGIQRMTAATVEAGLPPPALEEHLAVPFAIDMLGVEVTVGRVDLADDDRIVAVCVRGTSRQRISILDLPLPDALPAGWEWIEAYRRWARGR